VYNFGGIRSRNLRVYAVNNSTFIVDKAKIGISRKISQIILNLSDILYRFGRRISGRIIQIFVWRSPKECCYGNQLNLGHVRRRRMERPIFFASAFDNGLAYHKSAFKMFNSNNNATWFSNLVNFHPIISEFLLLKRAIFAAIRPQLDDDLHSSCWRSKNDWKIVILTSAQ